tara:strand:- start:183 stop:554 length:372 start_codon:yes stop_codon:yes gene_type:complete
MFSFYKQERLNNKKRINKLFSSGKFFFQEPFQIYWLETKQEKSIIELLVSVPKKNIKLAVNRNIIKRMVKEAYRLNKKALYEQVNREKKSFSVAIIYMNNKIPSYFYVEKKIKLILERFTTII